jgi:hypothetical protein
MISRAPFSSETALASDSTLIPYEARQEAPQWLLSTFAPALFVINNLVMAGTKSLDQMLRFIPTTPTYLTGSAHLASSTAPERADLAAKLVLDTLWASAQGVIIEDGMHNVINQSLPKIIMRYKRNAIPEIASVIESERVSPTVTAEILKELGKVREPATYSSRRWLLERALRSNSPITRDGAGLGLARLGDRHALPFLLSAIEAEADPQARRDLQLVVDELYEHGVPSETHL